MICFRDMTFCDFYKKCKKSSNCERPLTDKVVKEANNWMKNAPICRYAEKPECYEEKDVKFKEIKIEKQNKEYHDKCPKCNGDLIYDLIPCPDGINGCLVAHYGYICNKCNKIFSKGKR